MSIWNNNDKLVDKSKIHTTGIEKPFFSLSSFLSPCQHNWYETFRNSSVSVYECTLCGAKKEESY